MDYSPPGSSVHGLLQARILEWVDISYSKGIFLIQRSNLCLGSPALTGRFFTTEKPRKPQSTSKYVRVCVCVCVQSCLTLATPRTVACQAPLSMDFSRQEYWSSHSFHSPEYLPNPGIEGRSHRRQILYCLSYQGSPTATHIYLL